MKQGIKEADIEDFERYAHKLVEVLQRIREYNPEANAYLSSNSLNLMSQNFLELPWVEQQNYIVTNIYMPGFDGGDF